jgi:hypothetical protein
MGHAGNHYRPFLHDGTSNTFLTLSRTYFAAAASWWLRTSPPLAEPRQTHTELVLLHTFSATLQPPVKTGSADAPSWLTY